MVQRVRIGDASTPFRVLDASGTNSSINNLFDANYKAMRSSIVDGVGYNSGSSSLYFTVNYGQTFATPPFFFMYYSNYYSGTANLRNDQPRSARSNDNTSTNGGSARAFTSYIEFMNWNPGVGRYFYYRILKNLLP